MDQARQLPTPSVCTTILTKSNGDPLENAFFYQSTIAILQYSTMTCLVSKLSQFLQSPTTTHWNACKRVLRHLKVTIDHGISFRPLTSRPLIGFADDDSTSSPDDHRSTSGYCIYYGGNLIFWSSKKQGGVARSITEAEYRALAYVTTELI